MFVKSNNIRGDLPIGVTRNGYKYSSNFYKHNQRIHLGTFDTPEEAFQMYKEAKESYIKQVAEEEYAKGNITKRCYDAMMNYEVEITD